MTWWLRAKDLGLACIYKHIITLLAAVLCMGIGVLALIGWYAHTPGLFQIRPEFGTMHFTAAFCFVLLGGGMVLLLSSCKKWSFFLEIFVVIIAFFSLLEYAFHLDLKISQFFFKTDINYYLPALKHMNANSAISLFACGVSIILLSLRISKLFYCTALFLAICTLALGSVSLWGYAVQLPAAYVWAKLAPMPLLTAIAFMIVSSGIIFFIYIKHLLREINLSSTLPYFAALFVLCLTFLVWQAFLQEATRNLQEITNTRAERIHENVKEKISECLSELEELRFQWQTLPAEPDEFWLKSSEFRRKNASWYKVIEWIDSSFHIRGVTPLHGNESLLSLTFDSTPFFYEILKQAKNQKILKLSKIINLAPQGQGFFICLPLFKKSHFEGFIIGVIDVDVMLRTIIAQSQNAGFKVSFFEDIKEKQSFSQTQIGYTQNIYARQNINIHNLHWTVEVWPSVGLYRQHTYTVLSKLILSLGPFVAFLLFAVVHSRQATREKSRMLKEAKKNLEFQLLESSRRTKELGYLKDMMNILQKCASLEEAKIPIKKFCRLFFPSADGILYLIDNSSKMLIPFSQWGKKFLNSPFLLKEECFALVQRRPFYLSDGSLGNCCAHTKRFLPCQEVRPAFICIPLLNQGKLFGLLHIYDSHLLSKSKSAQKKKILLAETLAQQLSLSLISLQIHDLLSHRAIRDSLTNLYNRRYFEESLRHEIYRAKRSSQAISLLMLDVDYFKVINDTYGHEIGDEVLKSVGDLLQQHTRKSDIACRFGGEEFILILPDTTMQIASQRAEKLRQAVSVG